MKSNANRQGLFIDLEPAVVEEMRGPDPLVANAESHEANGNLGLAIEGEIRASHDRLDLMDVIGAAQLATDPLHQVPAAGIVGDLG